MITFFLVNAESLALAAETKSELTFTHFQLGMYTTNQDTPEAVTAYEQEFVEQLFRSRGLEILTPIHYGRWCRRKEYLTYQDLVIVSKL